MKIRSWNLDGIFAERPFRWAAMNMLQLAPASAKLDGMVGNDGLNAVEKWTFGTAHSIN